MSLFVPLLKNGYRFVCVFLTESFTQLCGKHRVPGKQKSLIMFLLFSGQDYDLLPKRPLLWLLGHCVVSISSVGRGLF